MNYIDRLIALRVDSDTTQKKIAALLFYHRATVSRIEARGYGYSIEDIIKLCTFYNVSADYVLGLPKGMPYPSE